MLVHTGLVGKVALTHVALEEGVRQSLSGVCLDVTRQINRLRETTTQQHKRVSTEQDILPDVLCVRNSDMDQWVT